MGVAASAFSLRRERLRGRDPGGVGFASTGPGRRTSGLGSAEGLASRRRRGTGAHRCSGGPRRSIAAPSRQQPPPPVAPRTAGKAPHGGRAPRSRSPPPSGRGSRGRRHLRLSRGTAFRKSRRRGRGPGIRPRGRFYGASRPVSFPGLEIILEGLGCCDRPLAVGSRARTERRTGASGRPCRAARSRSGGS